MGRMRRGWELTKKSWALLRAHPSLARFPLYGAIATTLLAIVVLGPGLFFLDDDKSGVGIPLIVIGVYLLTVAGLYFSVGLAAAANMIFQGKQATVGDGLAVSRERFTQILGWAAVSTTVSVVIGAIENRAGPAGDVVARLVGAAWTLVTVLVVPVIAIEGAGPVEALKRSGSLFRERWGQQITGNIAIGGAVMLIVILPAIGLIVGGAALWSSIGFAGALLVALGVVLFAVGMVVSKALSGIFGVALYHYALEGQTVGNFTQDDLESAVKQKRGRFARGTI